jgi:hypothetical protein
LIIGLTGLVCLRTLIMSFSEGTTGFWL